MVKIMDGESYLAEIIYSSKHNIISHDEDKQYINGYKAIFKTNFGDFPDFTKGYKKIKVGSTAIILKKESDNFFKCFVIGDILFISIKSIKNI
jgi:predicted ester cyclase